MNDTGAEAIRDDTQDQEEGPCRRHPVVPHQSPAMKCAAIVCGATMQIVLQARQNPTLWACARSWARWRVKWSLGGSGYGLMISGCAEGVWLGRCHARPFCLCLLILGAKQTGEMCVKCVSACPAAVHPGSCARTHRYWGNSGAPYRPQRITLEAPGSTAAQSQKGCNCLLEK